MDPAGNDLEPLEVVHHATVAQLPPAPPPPPAQRRRKTPVAAVGGVALLVAGGLGVAGMALSRSGDSRGVEQAEAASWTGLPEGDEVAPVGWRRGAPGPVPSRSGAAVVWTGSELLVWGGDPPGEGSPAGAAYAAAADRWRPMAPAPFRIRTVAVAAWTGFEMVLWGGFEPGRGAPETGGAYDPVADRWRTIAPAPLPAGLPVTSAWTGRELVVAGVDAGFGQGVSPEAAAYDPAADSWRRLPPLPVALTAATGLWTGSEVVVVGAVLRPEELPPDQATRPAALAYDPAGNTWRSLPSPPLASQPLATTAVWTGNEIVAWDFELHAARLDPAARTGAAWTALPDLPLEFRDCLPLGAVADGMVFAEHCGQAAVYRSPAEGWSVVPHPRKLAVRPVWTGEELLFWTGGFVGSADGIWRLRIPPRAESR